MKASGLALACVSIALFAPACAKKHGVAPRAGNWVAISVTENGFEPAVVTVPAGKPVTLVVTRKTDRTCARDFVMAAKGIAQPLPLDEPVEIQLGPENSGDLGYACGMDMFRGTVRVVDAALFSKPDRSHAHATR
jgi:plastocyanin domain-containing protein